MKSEREMKGLEKGEGERDERRGREADGRKKGKLLYKSEYSLLLIFNIKEIQTNIDWYCIPIALTAFSVYSVLPIYASCMQLYYANTF